MNFRRAFSLIEISIVILIIGILVGGISSGLDLYQDYRLRVARNLTINSRVARIADLNLWLETTSEKSLQNNNNSYSLLDEDTVKNWNDINPTRTEKFVATQSDVSKQPIYKKNGIGGLPTLFFDASSNGSTGKGLSIPYDLNLNTTEFTIFLVIQPLEATSGWGTIIMSRDGATNTSGYNLYKSYANDNFQLWAGTGVFWYYTASPIKFNKELILSIVSAYYSSDNKNMNSIYENSVIKSSALFPFAPNRIYPFSIGNDGNNGSNFDGNISEIIFYGRNLNDSERLAVEKYLSQKYQIKL